MPDQPPETAVRSLLFKRLAETNRDLIQGLADLSLQIYNRDSDTVLGILLDVENRLQSMRNIISVFEEHLER